MRRAEIQRKFDEIVEFAEVEQFIDTPVKRYSSGMYVRLAFAVAAHLEPEILIVDEVLAVGDAQFQKKCLGKMQDAGKEGRTVLFVSHNMNAIQRLCQKSLLLEKGVLVEQGDTQQVMEKYLVTGSSGDILHDKLDCVPRRRGLGELIRFNRCFILNSKNEITDRLLFGERFSVIVEVVAETIADGISVIIGIDTALEYRVTTIASEDSKVLFNVTPNKTLKIQAQVDELVLKPGSYTISLGLRIGKRPIDHLPYIKRFEITETAQGKNRFESDTWGVVHTQAQWITEPTTCYKQ
jgi:lipopolysaccharide transport system ATP-binding protein